MSLADRLTTQVCTAAASRGCACLSAFAAVVATSLPVGAQIDWHKVDIWKRYRREDLGFEVEMPGEPEIEEEQDEHAKSIHAEFLFVGMMFGVDHVAFKHNATIEDVTEQQRKATQRLNGRTIRETPFMMDGGPAIEIVTEMENAFMSIMRAVVIGNRAVAVVVLGGPDITADPSARRFLDSFKLLPTAHSK